jgi:hypothetical protein
MALVADNSVVLAWFVGSESTAYSERMLARIGQRSVNHSEPDADPRRTRIRPGSTVMIAPPSSSAAKRSSASRHAPACARARNPHEADDARVLAACEHGERPEVLVER